MLAPVHGANLDYQPAPTCLHFRAIWKTGPEWGPAPLERWQRAAHDGWWPESLRLGVPADTLPQAHVWEQLADGGPDWLEACRAGVISVIDGLAWDVAMEQPRLERRLVDGGWALVRGGKHEEALALAESAMAVVPASAPLSAIQATAALGLGDAAASIASAQRAVELDPGLVRGYRVLARALVVEGRTDEAIEVLQSGVAIGPDNAGLHAQLGGLLLDAGDTEAARTQAAEAERLAPSAAATKRLRDRLS